MDRKITNTHILCGVGLAIGIIFTLWYFFIRDSRINKVTYELPLGNANPPGILMNPTDPTDPTNNISAQIEQMVMGRCNCEADNDSNTNIGTNPEPFGNINFY